MRKYRISPDKFLPALIAIHKGFNTKEKIASEIKYSERQTRDLLRIMRKAGVIEQKGKHWELSTNFANSPLWESLINGLELPKITVLTDTNPKKKIAKIHPNKNNVKPLFLLDFLNDYEKMGAAIADPIGRFAKAGKILYYVIYENGGGSCRPHDLFLDSFCGSNNKKGAAVADPFNPLFLLDVSADCETVHKSYDINTMYLLLLLLYTTLYIYFVNVIAKLEQLPVNGNLDNSARLNLELEFTSGVVVRIPFDSFVRENEKLIKNLQPGERFPGGVAELTRRAIKGRGRVKRSELDVAIEDVINFWNEQPNLRSHKKGTKLYSRIKKYVRFLLTGKWRTEFVLKNGLGGKVEMLIEAKKKFTASEIKEVIKRYNNYVKRVKNKAMLAGSLDKFIYNSVTGGSWFFSLYVEMEKTPEIDELKTLFGEDYKFVESKLVKLLEYSGRKVSESEFSEIVLPLLPAKRHISEQRKKAVDYVQSLQLGDKEKNLVKYVQDTFSFARMFSDFYIEVGRRFRDDVEFSEKLNKWTFRDVLQFAMKYTDKLWVELRKIAVEVAEYE